jgi:hypothetical protein
VAVSKTKVEEAEFLESKKNKMNVKMNMKPACECRMLELHENIAKFVE